MQHFSAKQNTLKKEKSGSSAPKKQDFRTKKETAGGIVSFLASSTLSGPSQLSREETEAINVSENSVVFIINPCCFESTEARNIEEI